MRDTGNSMVNLTLIEVTWLRTHNEIINSHDFLGDLIRKAPPLRAPFFTGWEKKSCREDQLISLDLVHPKMLTPSHSSFLSPLFLPFFFPVPLTSSSHFPTLLSFKKIYCLLPFAWVVRDAKIPDALEQIPCTGPDPESCKV